MIRVTPEQGLQRSKGAQYEAAKECLPGDGGGQGHSGARSPYDLLYLLPGSEGLFGYGNDHSQYGQRVNRLSGALYPAAKKYLLTVAIKVTETKDARNQECLVPDSGEVPG